MQTDPPSSPPPDSAARLEQLVALGLDRARTSGAAAFVQLAAEHPAYADALRARFALLERFGMLQAAAPPAAFGAFATVRELGRGGMGTVYLAQAQNGVRVAVKLAAGSVLVDPRARARFAREIEILRSLQHPCLVPVLDSGTIADVPWFAMEYVDGSTWADVLTRARSLRKSPAQFDDDEVERALTGATTAPTTARERGWIGAQCGVVLDVADALGFLHAHGVVHRDVKPSNVFVGADGRARLFDLGLARVDDARDLTRSGDFAGTPHYTAPEQITSRYGAVTARADVFALGVAAYESLSLVRPFEGADAHSVFARVLHDAEPSLRRVAPRVPRELAAVIERALEKDPRRRYADGAELAADLRRFLAWKPVHARSRGFLSRVLRAARAKPALTVASTLVALVVLGVPIGLTIAQRALVRQRDRAELEAAAARVAAAKSRHIATFLEGLLAQDGVANDAEARPAAERLLDVGSRLADDARAGDAPARASLLETLARAELRIGRHDRAIPLLDRALALAETAPRRDATDVASILANLARAHLANGDLDSALALTRRALTGDAATPATRAVAQSVAADVMRARGDFVASCAYARSVIDDVEAPAVDRARSLAQVGFARFEQGDLDAARATLEQALVVANGVEPAPFGDLARVHAALAEVHARAGRAADADRCLDEAVALVRKGHGDDARSIADVLRGFAARVPELPALPDVARRHGCWLAWIARAQLAAGDSAAVATFEAALARLDAGGADAVERAAVQLWLAAALATSGEPERADPLYLAAATGVPERPDYVEPWMIDALEAAAHAHERASRPREATALAQRAARLAREAANAHGIDPARAERALVTTARLYARAGDAAGSERALREAQEFQSAWSIPARSSGAFALGRETLEGDEDLAALYAARFQEGITALQAGRPEHAERCFSACLALRPQRSMCAYNAACARAALGDADGAVAWLERALVLGFAARDDAIALLRFDPDIDGVRESPRFERLLAEAERRRSHAFGSAHAHRTHVPAGLDPARPAPVLVVLHARGASPSDVVDSAWRDVADALGCVLLAPAATITVGDGADAGLTWFPDLDQYRRRAVSFERSVDAALDALRASRAIDNTRLVIAGIGQGGTVAMHVATRSPGSFRGVILEDASVAFDAADAGQRNLGALRTPIAMVRTGARAIDLLGRNVDPSVHLDTLAAKLRALGFRITRVAGSEPADLVSAARDVMRGA